MPNFIVILPMDQDEVSFCLAEYKNMGPDLELDRSSTGLRVESSNLDALREFLDNFFYANREGFDQAVTTIKEQ